MLMTKYLNTTESLIFLILISGGRDTAYIAALTATFAWCQSVTESLRSADYLYSLQWWAPIYHCTVTSQWAQVYLATS